MGILEPVTEATQWHEVADMWIVLLMIFLTPFSQNPHLSVADSFLGIIPKFTMIKLIGLIGLGYSLLVLTGGRTKLRLLGSSQGRVFWVFVMTVIFSSIVNGATAIAASRLLAIIFFLPIVLAAVRAETDLRLALKAAAACMILLFPYAYRQMLRFGGRYGVGLYDSNYLALALLLFFPVCLVLARQELRPWKRKWWIVGMWIILLQIILTGSRGGFLGLLVIVLLLSFQLIRRRVSALAGFACLLCLPFILHTTLASRIRSSSLSSGVAVENTGAKASMELRMQILKVGLQMVQENPFFGVGLGRFKETVDSYNVDEAKIAHNTYLELAAELGLPALGAFLWLLWITFSSLRRSRHIAVSVGRSDLAELATAIQIGLTGYLVSATFLSAEFEKFFWLVVFLTICFERILREQAEKTTGSRQQAESSK